MIVSTYKLVSNKVLAFNSTTGNQVFVTGDRYLQNITNDIV